MKKIIFLTLVMLFSLAIVIVTPAFASETPDQKLEELSKTGEIIYQDDEITVRSFGNDPEISDACFLQNKNTQCCREFGVAQLYMERRV